MSDLGALAGKSAIVTGGGRGIGRAIALAFARAGASVAVATRTPEHGESTVEAIRNAGGRALFLQTELESAAVVADITRRAADAFGGLDIVVHNAAYVPTGRVGTITDEALDRAWTVNVKAGVWLTQSALPYLRQRGGGRILFTSSVTAQRAYPGSAAYSATKAGLNGFIRGAAVELGRENITVNGIEPGVILTDALTKHDLSQADLDNIASYIPMRRLGAPEEVADAMVFLASEGSRYVTGQLLVVDGGTILAENGAFMRGA